MPTFPPEGLPDLFGRGIGWSGKAVGARLYAGESGPGAGSTARDRDPHRLQEPGAGEASVQAACLPDSGARGPSGQAVARPLRPVQRRPPGTARSVADATAERLLWRSVGTAPGDPRG